MSTESKSSEKRIGRAPMARGGAFVFIGAIGLAVNVLWLYTGDVRGPHGTFAMHGGWKGLWLSTVLFVLFVVAGLFYVVVGFVKYRKERRSLLS